jgi:hypothetical protein
MNDVVELLITVGIVTCANKRVTRTHTHIHTHTNTNRHCQTILQNIIHTQPLPPYTHRHTHTHTHTLPPTIIHTHTHYTHTYPHLL